MSHPLSRTRRTVIIGASLWLGAFTFPTVLIAPWATLCFGLSAAAIALPALLRPRFWMAILGVAGALVALSPTAYVIYHALASGILPLPRMMLNGVAATAALLATAPLLTSNHSRARFTPAHSRNWFLSGTITSIAAGWLLLHMAGVATYRGETLHASMLALGAVMLHASALGILHMRAWGVLLGLFGGLSMFIYTSVAPYYPHIRLLALGIFLLLAVPLLRGRWQWGVITP